MASIWLVRHAPPARVGVCYGQSDVPVTLEPSEAARVIAQRWQDKNPHCVPELWTSPWARTQSVAEELARQFGTGCQVDARLSELAFGEWEGRTYAELEASDADRFQHWLQHYEVEAPPGGETVAALRQRVSEWLAFRSATDGTVLVVTHAGVIRTAHAVHTQRAYSAVAGDPVPHLEPQRLT